MKEWRDVSSHSRSDKVREPNAYEMKTNGLRITVHRHRDYENSWLFSCYDIKIEAYDLGPISIEEAKHKAIEVIRLKLEGLLKEIID